MFTRHPPVYSRAEHLSDAAIHVLGIVLALIGGPVLIALAVLWIGDGTIVAAMAVYALTLLAMLAASALYNMTAGSGRSERFRRLDQTAIYFKIAGTYTPFIILSGSQAIWFLAGIWSVAVGGASVILFGRGRLRFLAIAAYLALGWAGILFGGPLLFTLDGPVLALLLIGGALYSGGVAFLVWEALPFHNTIWHGFVLAATAVCYAALAMELVARSATPVAGL